MAAHIPAKPPSPLQQRAFVMIAPLLLVFFGMFAIWRGGWLVVHHAYLADQPAKAIATVTRSGRAGSKTMTWFIDYQFSDALDRVQTGSAHGYRKQIGETILVEYARDWPAINRPAGSGKRKIYALRWLYVAGGAVIGGFGLLWARVLLARILLIRKLRATGMPAKAEITAIRFGRNGMDWRYQINGIPYQASSGPTLLPNEIAGLRPVDEVTILHDAEQPQRSILAREAQRPASRLDKPA